MQKQLQDRWGDRDVVCLALVRRAEGSNNRYSCIVAAGMDEVNAHQC